MGVSFKVSNKGTRFRPKPKPTILPQHQEEAQIDNNIQTFIVLPKPSDDVTENNKDEAEISDADISFVINLFPDGYSIRNPSENRVNQAVQDDPKLLLPYDRTSESLFSAIERGLLPADFLDDIPCKFINGAVACVVRDYRKCGIEAGINSSTTDSLSPITSKIRLKMSLENVVKDLPLISNSSWTYGDLMEAEARILKVLHPKLDLDPSPNVFKLCKPPTSTNLNLNIRELRRKRLRQMSGCDNLVHVKKVCMDRGQENSNPGPMVQPPDLVNQTIQNTVPASPSLSYHVGNPRLMQDHGLGAVQDMMNSYTDNRHSNLGKRENQDGQLSPLTGLPAKRARSNSMGLNGSQQPQMDVFDSLMQQQRHQSVGRGVQLPLPTSTGIQKYPFEGSFNQDPFTMGQPGIRYNLKQEPVDFEQHQRLTQQFSRSNFPPTPWNNNNNNNNDRKEEQFQRRKSAQSPRVSSGALPQSPLPSKSGEFPSGPAPLGSFQRDKSAVTSVLAVGGPGSLTSNAQMATRRTNGNIGAPLNATSSLAGKEFDKSMLDKMSKIEMLTLRYKLNMKKIKVDEYRDTTTFSTQQLSHFLLNDHNNENPKDEDCKTPLSKSLVGGNMNVCKARILDIMPTERVLQGHSLLVVPTIRRMILSEKQDDGTVAMLYGELDDYDYSAVEEYLPTLPNTHVADLLADQFCTLISREGYRVEGDYIHPKSTNINSNNASAISPNAELPESVSGQPSNEIAKPSDTVPSNNDNGLVNSSGARMHPPANSQPLQVSQGGLLPPAHPMQPDSQPSFQQNQQVGHMLQRSSAMMHTSSPLNSNIQQVGHMLNKATPQQLQMIQQQQPQPLQMQRKMMTGFGSVGIGGNTGNNMVGLQAMGSIRGNNMGQSPISVSQAANFSNIISQQLRSGMISPAQAAIMTTRLRMSQNRNIISGSGGQSGNITGLLGASRQVHPGPSNYSMQGPAINRANTMNPMQRTAMAPPKMLSGGMNQQQQQQESTSPLQAVLSPPQQVGSPPIGLPQQQQASPQQMSPQLSSGTMQPPMSAGNQEANGPASPQLSSQTMGSVGSMVNSPMDLQGS